MSESYLIIEDILHGGYWDDHEQRFRGIIFTYKIKAFDNEFQKARKVAECGVQLIRVYN